MTNLLDGMGIGVMPQGVDDADEEKEKCKRIYIHAFRGDRSQTAMDAFDAQIDAGKAGNGSGPSGEDCLLYTGHVGISFEADSPIYGFNPDTGDEPSWKVIENLKQRKGATHPYKGKVTDDTSVFSAARARGLPVLKLELVYPESVYNDVKRRFDAEKSGSKYHYSFPGRGGDCNCATWPSKLGIFVPEISGVMKAYIDAMGKVESPRKMGICEG